MSHVLQVAADVVHVGIAQENPGKVFLTDGGEAPGVGEELNLQHLRLQVVHEPARERRRKEVAEEETMCQSQLVVEQMYEPLKPLNSLVKIFKFQLSFALFSKEMNQQRRLSLLVHMLPDRREHIKDIVLIKTHRMGKVAKCKRRCSRNIGACCSGRQDA